MNKPKMIMFDYGQTLIREAKFDGVRGTEAVLAYAVRNKYNKSAKEVQAYADKLNKEIGRFDRTKIHLFQHEVPNHMFTRFLYESLGIEIALSAQEIDDVFWNAAAPGTPTDGLSEFLAFLKQNDIGTAVISNISFCAQSVTNRINKCIPNNEFEFILATSDYLFRKPNRHIFDLALEKAELEAGDVWYVGDQYKCDVVGARNAGMFPVWYTGAIDTKSVTTEDVLTVKEWKELIDYLNDMSIEY